MGGGKMQLPPRSDGMGQEPAGIQAKEWLSEVLRHGSTSALLK
jgi:hypothetical protein